MWISLNKAFLSIIEPAKNDPEAQGGDMLLVRARVRGHIEAAFPFAKGQVLRRPGRDYLYRAYLDRATVAQSVMGHVLGIHYGNFKDSVEDKELHDAYARVWGNMASLQYVRPYSDDSERARVAETAREERQAHAAKRRAALFPGFAGA